MNRTMVTFEQVSLFAIQIVHPNPLVASASGDEPILQDRVDRSGRGGVRQSEAMSLASIQQSRDERDRLARGDDKPVRRCREFHGRDWAGERETGRELPRPQIPPPAERGR